MIEMQSNIFIHCILELILNAELPEEHRGKEALYMQGFFFA